MMMVTTMMTTMTLMKTITDDLFIHTSVLIETWMFFNNHTLYKGGVMYDTNGTTITIVNSTFKNNTAQYGAVMNASMQSRVVLLDNLYEWNMAHVAYLSSKSIIMSKNSIFNSNIAENSGSVVYLENLSSSTVHNSIYTCNTANEQFFTQIEGSIFRTNMANLNNSMQWNLSTSMGGVIFAHNCKIVMKHNSFTSNIAAIGGVVKASINVLISRFENSDETFAG